MIADNTTIRANQFAGLFDPAFVDIFAGGGGWSIGAEQAMVEGGYHDRYVDLMINHWSVAVGVHSANHPMTEHLKASVWEVDPNDVLPGRRLAYLHASPDCTHFSRARGSRPVKKEIRALADVVLVWADKRRPDVITLENVAEFTTWGPLGRDGQPDKARAGQEFKRWKKHLQQLGYVVEHRVLVASDYGAPTSRKRLFVIARCDGKPIIWPEKTHGILEQYERGSKGCSIKGRSGGRLSRNCKSERYSNSGLYESSHSPCDRNTSAGRCSGAKDTQIHAGGGLHRPRLKPYRTAAECIDWSIPMLSIFATPAQAKTFARVHGCGVPRRPLKAKTLQRIARGLVKFVLQAQRPFLVNIQNYGWNSSPVVDVDQPMPTVTGSPKGGAYAAVDATIAPYTVPNLGERDGQQPRCGSVEQPMPTITGTGSGASLVAALLSTLNHDGEGHRAQSVDSPLHTITSARDARALTCAHLMKFRGASAGNDLHEPMPTVTAGAGAARDAGAAHALGLSSVYLSQFRGTNDGTTCGDVDQPLPTITGQGNHASIIAAFLSTYYGNTQDGQTVDVPAPTIVGKDRIQLVTVKIDGQTYVVTDIAMRMLTPRELARAQGFPNDYIIDRQADGTPVSKADQVKLIGNSVPPAFARAIVKANVVDQGVLESSKNVFSVA